MRIEIIKKEAFSDGRAVKILKGLHHKYGRIMKRVYIADVYIIEDIDGFDSEIAASIFLDPVVEEIFVNNPVIKSDKYKDWDFVVEITYKAGVTDPVAKSAREAIFAELGRTDTGKGIVQTGVQYIISADHFEADELDSKNLADFFFNPLIQYAYYFSKNDEARIPETYPNEVPESNPEVERFSLTNMDNEELQNLSKKRVLALNQHELSAIKNYFLEKHFLDARKQTGLDEQITDVELEMIAQTWSEHCKHKIFQAEIQYKENNKEEVINSLFKEYISAVTESISGYKDYLRSVFHDNSGVIQFDDEHCVCIKAETHNSPSALDPYGGAITGIVGVNRDIIGTGRGARPIFNTNVLCFGNPSLPEGSIPKSLLHPKRVMEGVHRGIVDGGNQSGIPVVGGAFLFDDSYTGKPLVFCGTGGLMPSWIGNKPSWEKWINPGDLAVMTGGSIGKDGIHGATFSSLELNEASPLSAVQIGDPITQKKMLDFLMEARTLELFNSITDNGAGGLSSSLGEMAEQSGGIRIDLERCPLKYHGLAPWEILLSESQERMSLAVPPDKINDFLSLAKKRGVTASVIGEFTDSGYVQVRYESETVAYLPLDFLHHGNPQLKLEAVWRQSDNFKQYDLSDLDGDDINKYLRQILADPNVASKEFLIRQYDHEVIGQSVIKPFTGLFSDAPSDGAVIRPVYDSFRGLTVTHGICSRYSDFDTYHMAMCAVDEAYRAHIACGGNPEYVSALDNFCWPDPVFSQENPDGKYKLAQLVRAAKGMSDSCKAYGIPLISGKDSMKNDTKIDGKKISVRPTLLITVLGIIDDIRKAVSTDFKNSGDLIYCLGETKKELGGSVFEKISGKPMGPSPIPVPEKSLPLYRNLASCIDTGIIKSCHDCSDGGAGVAIAESILGGRYGADIHAEKFPGYNKNELNIPELLFSETQSRFIISIDQSDKERFEQIINQGLMEKDCLQIGEVTTREDLRVFYNGKAVLSVSIKDIENAWFSFERDMI